MKLQGPWARACAILWLSSVAWAADSRVVITGNANLRAQPTLDAEILASLKKGESHEGSPKRVTNPKATSDEPAEWVELVAPPSAKVWIAAGLVDLATKKVRVEKAHLRAGPGTNFSEVGHVPKGTELDVSTRLDGWIRIAAPAGAVRGYVAAELTKPADGTVAPVAAATNAPLARMKPPAAGLPAARGQAPLPTNASRPVVTAGRALPPFPSVAGRPLVVPPPPPLPPVAAKPAEPARAEGPVESVAPSPVPTTPVPPAAANAAPDAIATPEPSIPVASGSGRQAEIVFLNEKPRPVMRQGVVALSLSPQAPGRFQLDSFRRGEGAMAFLITENPEIDLEKWHTKHVVIQGEEYRDARWRTRSVIKVRSIEPVP